MKWLALAVALMGADRLANANQPDNETTTPNSNVERDYKAQRAAQQAKAQHTVQKQHASAEQEQLAHADRIVGATEAKAHKQLKQVKEQADKFSTQAVDNTFYMPLNESLVLDPAFVTDRESTAVLENLFDTLVHVNADGGYDMLAAESYEVSANGKRWLFKLREDARWSDDTPVTAYDFVYAWQRLVDPAIKSPNRYILTNANILNAADVASGTKSLDQLGVVALNDYELLIVLDKPTPWLLSVLASAATIPLKYNPSPDASKGYADLTTNGAYRFSPNANNDFLLVKNEHYWDAANVHINHIRSYGNKADASAEGATRNIIYLNAHNKERLEQQYPQQISTIIYPESKFLITNMQDRSMGKLEVRQALNLLLDRNRLVEEMNTTAVPTTVFAPPVLETKQIKQDTALLTDVSRNLKKAVKLLKRAGYSESNPLVLRYIYNLDVKKPQHFIFHKAVTDMLMENSNNVVRIEYVGLNNTQYFNALKTGDYQLTALSWRSDYNHASAFFNMLQSEESDNFAHYNSFEYDYLISEAYRTKEASKREELYAQANLILQRDLPVLPIFWQADKVITDPRLKNFAANGSTLIKNMYFDTSPVGTKVQYAGTKKGQRVPTPVATTAKTTTASGVSTGENTALFLVQETQTPAQKTSKLSAAQTRNQTNN